MGSPLQSPVRRDVSTQCAERTGRSPTTTAANPNWPIVKLDRNLPAQTPAGKSYHIHGTPVYMERANSGNLVVWGENERLKAYNYDFATKRIASFSAQGMQVASGNDPGMPGGRLVVSSNGTHPGTGVVWGTYPVLGDANSKVVPGALVASTRRRPPTAAEAAFSQQTRRVGVLRQVLHAGGGEREGLRRDVQQQGRPVRPLTRRPVPPRREHVRPQVKGESL